MNQLEDLLAKITSRTATVGVIGLGYVGLLLELLDAIPDALVGVYVILWT